MCSSNCERTFESAFACFSAVPMAVSVKLARCVGILGVHAALLLTTLDNRDQRLSLTIDDCSKDHASQREKATRNETGKARVPDNTLIFGFRRPRLSLWNKRVRTCTRPISFNWMRCTCLSSERSPTTLRQQCGASPTRDHAKHCVTKLVIR
jgi:hypothetical protein